MMIPSYRGQRSTEVKCGKICSMATTYKSRMMMMTFMEVTNSTKDDWLAGPDPVTMVLNLKFSVQLIVSCLTLLIVKYNYILCNLLTALWIRKLFVIVPWKINDQWHDLSLMFCTTYDLFQAHGMLLETEGEIFIWKNLTVIGGIYLFFLTERILKMFARLHRVRSYWQSQTQSYKFSIFYVQ